MIGGSLYIDFLQEVNTKGMSKEMRHKEYANWKKHKGFTTLPDIPPSVRNIKGKSKQLPQIPKHNAIADLSEFLSNVTDEYLLNNYPNKLPRELIPYYNMLKSQFDLIK
jgi:hypothetical protein